MELVKDDERDDQMIVNHAHCLIKDLSPDLIFCGLVFLAYKKSMHYTFYIYVKFKKKVITYF